MNKPRRKTLEKKGWKVGTAEEFRGLSPEESRCIEMKLATSKTGSGHTLGTLERTKMNRNDTFGLCRKRFFVENTIFWLKMRFFVESIVVCPKRAHEESRVVNSAL